MLHMAKLLRRKECTLLSSSRSSIKVLTKILVVINFLKLRMGRGCSKLMKLKVSNLSNQKTTISSQVSTTSLLTLIFKHTVCLSLSQILSLTGINKIKSFNLLCHGRFSLRIWNLQKSVKNQKKDNLRTLKKASNLLHKVL
jgi:hypothetical protein